MRKTLSVGNRMTVRVRRRLSIGLILTVLAFAAFTVSHVHGVSDPHTHHTLVDFLIFAQAQSGFLVAGVLAIVFLLMFAGRVPGESRRTPHDRRTHACPSRAPPTLPV